MLPVMRVIQGVAIQRETAKSRFQRRTHLRGRRLHVAIRPHAFDCCNQVVRQVSRHTLRTYVLSRRLPRPFVQTHFLLHPVGFIGEVMRGRARRI